MYLPLSLGSHGYPPDIPSASVGRAENGCQSKARVGASSVWKSEEEFSCALTKTDGNSDLRGAQEYPAHGPIDGAVIGGGYKISVETDALP